MALQGEMRHKIKSNSDSEYFINPRGEIVLERKKETSDKDEDVNRNKILK